jgi:hypothetical protein
MGLGRVRSMALVQDFGAMGYTSLALGIISPQRGGFAALRIRCADYRVRDKSGAFALSWGFGPSDRED